MQLTANLTESDRARVDARLRTNLIAWLTSVRPSGQPVTIPVWFLLREDETIALYTRPGAEKLRNIVANPKVSLALDVSDIGRNIVRMEGTLRQADDRLPANLDPDYLAKYIERMAALFDTPEDFAKQFSVPLILTPTKIHA